MILKHENRRKLAVKSLQLVLAISFTSGILMLDSSLNSNECRIMVESLFG